MTDQEHADRIVSAAVTLERAIQEAERDGLDVDGPEWIQLQRSDGSHKTLLHHLRVTRTLVVNPDPLEGR